MTDIEAEIAEISNSPRQKHGKMPPRALINKAVEAARVYYGSIGKCRYADEQKLHVRLNKLLQQLVDKSQGGIELWNAERQIHAEARRLGYRLALPGVDI